MKLKQMILQLEKLLASVTLDDARKKEIQEQLDALKAIEEPDQKNKPSDKSDGNKNISSEELTVLKNELATVKDILVKQQERADKAEKAMQDKLQSDAKKKLDDYKKKVVEVEKKISPADMKEKWEALLEANFEATSKIIDALPAHPATQKNNSSDKSDGGNTGAQKKADSPILAKMLERNEIVTN